jgi:hypothetical protein
MQSIFHAKIDPTIGKRELQELTSYEGGKARRDR